MNIQLLTRLLGKLCLVVAFLFSTPYIHAQRKPGNEWINPAQQYYKIRLAKDGIYRIPKEDFAAAGANPDAKNPAKLQIFFRGKEIPATVKTTGGKLDYVEFYGQRNDGALDSVLYYNPADMPHRYKSIYDDSSSYFITWGAADGRRFKEQKKPFRFYIPFCDLLCQPEGEL